MEKILFICTGNTCRSVMAEAFAKEFLKKANLHNKFLVSSAGLSAYPGDMATENTINTMFEIKLDVSNHRSSRLSTEMVDESTFIFTMSNQHRDLLKASFPNFKEKIYILGKGIKDPYGQDIMVYRSTRDMIEGHTRNIITKIKSDEDNVGV